MKDMTTVLNKKIVNKETNEVRLVVKIDEENRKIFSVPASEPTAEPTGMAAASYDRRWRLCEEPVAEEQTTTESQAEEPKTEAPAAEDKPEPMKMSETITALDDLRQAQCDLLRGQAAPSGHYRSDYAESVRPLLHQEDLEVRERGHV